MAEVRAAKSHLESRFRVLPLSKVLTWHPPRHTAVVPTHSVLHEHGFRFSTMKTMSGHTVPHGRPLCSQLTIVASTHSPRNRLSRAPPSPHGCTHISNEAAGRDSLTSTQRDLIPASVQYLETDILSKCPFGDHSHTLDAGPYTECAVCIELARNPQN